jgi:hypothetical protein
MSFVVSDSWISNPSMGRQLSKDEDKLGTSIEASLRAHRACALIIEVAR